MSNEQGNDTAQAFQVGDRVRFRWHGAERGGEIIRFRRGGRVDVSDLEGVYRDRYGYTVPVSSLTLVSRGAPAASEPATPAPAAMVDALDTHTLAVTNHDGLVLLLGMRETCGRCGGSGRADAPDTDVRCYLCEGEGAVFAGKTVHLSDDMLHRLAGELAQRIHNSAPGGSR